MAGLGNPVYSRARRLSLKALESMSNVEILNSYTIMKVKFEFPSETKYPSIPCYIDKTSSIYPLKGVGVITGCEYILAKYQGCKMQISDIYSIPFTNSLENVKDETSIDDTKMKPGKEGKGYKLIKYYDQPFFDIIKYVQEKRKEHAKGTLYNYLYKEMGNSIYGSTVRGMSDKKHFDIQSGKTIRMAPGDLSNPIIAS